MITIIFLSLALLVCLGLIGFVSILVAGCWMYVEAHMRRRFRELIIALAVWFALIFLAAYFVVCLYHASR